MPSQLFTYRTTITGHEHIYELGLINMNGRMYDPLKYIHPLQTIC